MKHARALLDRSVEVHLNLIESVVQQQTINWGGKEQSIPQVGYRLKRNLFGEQNWKIQQIEALPSVAYLNSQNYLQLYTYIELGHEAMRGSANVVARSRGDLRTQITTAHLEPAVERSFFQQSRFPEFLSEEKILQFYEMLLNLSYENLESTPQFLERLDDFTKTNLMDLERFKLLARAVGVAHIRDAFHLWTAETNQLEYFLTMDQRFINILTKTSKLPLKTIPISPRDLVGALGLTELVPYPLDRDKIYNLLEES